MAWVLCGPKSITDVVWSGFIIYVLNLEQTDFLAPKGSFSQFQFQCRHVCEVSLAATHIHTQ